MATTLKDFIWVATGSAIGGVARCWISILLTAKLGKNFPWGTLTVNASGSFLIGVFASWAMAESRFSPTTQNFFLHFVMIGICGGYTTFSSFSLQTLNLLREGQWLFAGGNILLSGALCLLAVWLGFRVGAIFSN